MTDQTIITTRSQIVKAFEEWLRTWNASPEYKELLNEFSDIYAESAADYLIKLLHSVK